MHLCKLIPQNKITLLLFFTLFLFITIYSTISETEEKTEGAFLTGEYPDLFIELLGKNKSEVNARINRTWDQLFYGNNENERVYYPSGKDMAYIKDINYNDVRTEGMSYGMMIAVQLDKKDEFDRLWKWSSVHMQHKEGARKYFFAWQTNDSGKKLAQNSASDGEEWFVMSLFFAAARWGNGKGIFNYEKEAQNILNAMIGKTEEKTGIKDMFDKNEKQVVFVPEGNFADFTDPSYHLPHFYELWGLWAENNGKFWLEAADVSRNFFRKTVNPKTGLAPDCSQFNGKPLNKSIGGHDAFRFDAWRVAMNVAVDYLWFRKDTWAVIQSNRILNFFTSEGIDTYSNQYSLDGKKLSDSHSGGLVAMNAVAAIASTNPNRDQFVKALWDLPIPSGRYRYYDGMLQMLALLQVSGNFRIYHLTKKTD